MKKLNLPALALAFGLITNTLLVPVVYAEELSPATTETTTETAAEETTTTAEEPVAPTAETEEVAETTEAEEDDDQEDTEEVVDDEVTVLSNVEGLSDSTEDTVLPIDLPHCETLFNAMEGTTIKHGLTLAPYESVFGITREFVLRNPACRTELDNYDGVFLGSADLAEDGSTGQFYLYAYSYEYDEDGDWVRTNYHESKHITINFIADDSADRAATASDFSYQLEYETFTISGDEIKTFTSHALDDFYPAELSEIKTIIDSFEGVTISQNPAILWYAYLGDSDSEDSEASVTYSTIFFVDGYYYGEITFDVAYSVDAFEHEEEDAIAPTYAAAAKEEQLPTDTVFTATQQDGSTVSVVKENERLVVVYDFSMDSESGTIPSTFEYGVLVQLTVAGSLIDPSLPVYARYIDANGNAPEEDIPATIRCYSAQPMGVTDTDVDSSYCEITFTAPHFSDYAIIQKLPFELPNTPYIPATGAATTTDRNSAVATGFLPFLGALILATIGLVARLKKDVL